MKVYQIQGSRPGYLGIVLNLSEFRRINSLLFSLKSSKGELIRLNSQNIRDEIWRRSLRYNQLLRQSKIHTKQRLSHSSGLPRKLKRRKINCQRNRNRTQKKPRNRKQDLKKKQKQKQEQNKLKVRLRNQHSWLINLAQVLVHLKMYYEHSFYLFHLQSNEQNCNNFSYPRNLFVTVLWGLIPIYFLILPFLSVALSLFSVFQFLWLFFSWYKSTCKYTCLLSDRSVHLLIYSSDKYYMHIV